MSTMPAPKGHRMIQQKATDATCSITFYATINLRDRIKKRANTHGISSSVFLVRAIEELLAKMDELDFDGEVVVAEKDGTTTGRMSNLGSSEPKTYDARTGVWK